METVNGSVRAGGLTAGTRPRRVSARQRRVSFAEAPTTVTARTRDGAVEVVVPDDEAAYGVEVDTFVGDTDASSASIRAATDPSPPPPATAR